MMSVVYTSSHSDEVTDEAGRVVIADWGKFDNVSIRLLFTPLNRPKEATPTIEIFRIKNIQKRMVFSKNSSKITSKRMDCEKNPYCESKMFYIKCCETRGQ